MNIKNKDSIVKKLKENGCRITKQRLLLIDIILAEECSCSKEILYKANKVDKSIGSATVYRMLILSDRRRELHSLHRKLSCTYYFE